MKIGYADQNQSPDGLTNLKTVVCNAYNNDILVEVTLLDPWCPDWLTRRNKEHQTVAAFGTITSGGLHGSVLITGVTGSSQTVQW